MARRLLALAIVSALVGVAGPARDARAGATVDLLFVGKNGGGIEATSVVGARPGDTLTMAVRMRNDEPILLAMFSLNYDVDADDELDVVSAFQWSAVPIGKMAGDDYPGYFGHALALEPTTATYVGSFTGISNNMSAQRALPVAGGAFAGGYQMGTVVWQVNAGVNSDGADILSGILKPGLEIFFDAVFGDMDARVLFNSATVNFTPEPGTASLLGLGLLGLVLQSRRRRP